MPFSKPANTPRITDPVGSDARPGPFMMALNAVRMPPPLEPLALLALVIGPVAERPESRTSDSVLPLCTRLKAKEDALPSTVAVLARVPPDVITVYLVPGA